MNATLNKLVLAVMLMEYEQHARDQHNFARITIAMGREEAIKAITHAMITMPKKECEHMTAEQIYNRLEIINDCDTVFTVIDGKICAPSMFEGTDAAPFMPVPMPDEWHTEICADVERIKAGLEANAQAGTKEMLDRVMQPG